MNCRFCAAELEHSFVDLGMQPLSNAYVPAARAEARESFYPLHAFVCGKCFLVQLAEFESPEAIFHDYAYLSSMSTSWLAHCEAYATEMCKRLSLGARDLVIEVASNDGYLLQYFRAREVPVLGIEPAANVAEIAEKKGVPSMARFFGTELAKELVAAGKRARLLIGNNVLAHVPNLNDFVEGLRIALAPDGLLTMEFPHLLRLIEHNQFDTIYHEHFSYLSLSTVRRVFERHGLRVFEVDQLPTHGGSLRIHAMHAETAPADSESLRTVLADEERAGLSSLSAYLHFAERVRETKRKLLTTLIELKRSGKRIAAYGAPAKGNTLLNYCGIRSDFIEFTVDRSPLKQGTLLPGTRIPVLAPEALAEQRPDVIVLLPWNLEKELVEQLAYTREWGAKLLLPIPEPRIAP